MRGVWTLREYATDGTLTATGTLTFRGAYSTPDKGQVTDRMRSGCGGLVHTREERRVILCAPVLSQVTYVGEAAGGRGPWILKPDGFGRRQAPGRAISTCL